VILTVIHFLFDHTIRIFMERDILHINISAFPIGVERVIDSALRERPVVIAPLNSSRAVTLVVSREAYLEGVLKGMPVAQARKTCPGLMVIPPNQPLYRKGSKAIFDLLSNYSPLIEPWRAGHLHLDLSGTRWLFGLAVDTSAKIQKEIRNRFSLRSTVGVATNKLVSRVASRVIRPRGVCDVFSGSEATFLAPLEVGTLPGIGPKTEARLSDLNISLVGELAAIRPEHLFMAFGTLGYRLHQFALGIDDSPVRPSERAPLIREEETLAEDSNDDAVLLGVLYLMVERAARRLRKMRHLARMVKLEVTYADHVSASRELRLSLYLSLSLKDLVQGPRQLQLFPRNDGRERALVSALDSIRARYGEDAVRYGRTL
jgi:DNA polymerase-4